MGKNIRIWAENGNSILEGIRNRSVESHIAVDFLQKELHEAVYSYVNGGFSKAGYILYPFVKGLSKDIFKKISDVKAAAEFLDESGCDFSNSLSLYRNTRLNGKSAPVFISQLYRDFSGIEKSGVKNKKVRFKKIDIKDYNKKDFEYLKPVIELKDFANDSLRDFVVDMHIHGSIATRDYVKGWSDLDTLIIIKKGVINDAELLAELRKILYKSKKYFYLVDPLQHHGHMAVTEYDMGYYCQAFFPLVLFDYSKSVFGSKYLNFGVRDDKAERMGRFHAFSGYFKSLYSGRIKSMGCYELKFLLHMISLFPTMYLQAKGMHVYKKFSFGIAKRDFSKSEWNPIEAATGIRSRWNAPAKIPFTAIASRINPLLAYQANAKYWDITNKINNLNRVNVQSLVNGMHILSEKAKARIDNHAKTSL